MNKLQANLCLIIVTICWSAEVIVFSCIPGDIIPFATTTITNGIAAIILGLFFFKRLRDELNRSSKKFILRCFILGVLNCSYNALFLYGLGYLDVSSGAFSYSLIIVVLPFILLLMRKKVEKKTWISVILALSGILVALGPTLNSIEDLIGILIMLAGCVLRAVSIVKLNEYTQEHDPVSVSTFISFFVAIISFFVWGIMQPRVFWEIEWSSTAIASLFVYAYFIIVFAQTLNVFAQKRTTPTNATIIYSLEIVFSLIWGAVLPATLINRVIPSPLQIVGAVLIVAGSIVEIFDFKVKRRKQINAA